MDAKDQVSPVSLNICFLIITPSLVYTAVMEYAGIKIIRYHGCGRSAGFSAFLFISIGTLIGGIWGFIMDPDSVFIFLGLMTGMLVSSVLLILHLRQRRVDLEPTSMEASTENEEGSGVIHRSR